MLIKFIIRNYETKKSLDEYNKVKLIPIQESHRQRLLGWCNYYLGKKNLRELKHIGNEARKAFIKVLQIGQSRIDIDSALNGLSLVYYYLLNEPKKAFRVKEKTINKVHNKAQLLNTQGLLKRDEGQIIEALNTFSDAYNEARMTKDYRTSGHALNNKARTLMLLFLKLELKNELKKEILTLFEKAKIEYHEYEKSTGDSANFHLDGIEEQIRDLNSRYPWN
jgi:tetratricopeptide (TPR) repeat protein